jgi:hypothetical protein
VLTAYLSAALLFCGRGVRSDRRAMAMATAPASTASPASCPPISRGSSGRVADATAALTRRGCRLPGTAEVGFGDALLPGVTVGNRLTGLPTVVPVPGTVVTLPGSGGSAGTVGAGALGLVGAGVLGLVGAGVLGGAAVIRTLAYAWNETARFPLAVAVSVTFFPAAAVSATLTLAFSSSAWPVGRLPTWQTAPLADGQTVNSAPDTCATCRTAAETLTP